MRSLLWSNAEKFKKLWSGSLIPIVRSQRRKKISLRKKNNQAMKNLSKAPFSSSQKIV